MRKGEKNERLRAIYDAYSLEVTVSSVEQASCDAMRLGRASLGLQAFSLHPDTRGKQARSSLISPE